MVTLDSEGKSISPQLRADLFGADQGGKKTETRAENARSTHSHEMEKGKSKEQRAMPDENTDYRKAS